jgi:pyrroline-5-carboxylate reductase
MGLALFRGWAEAGIGAQVAILEPAPSPELRRLARSSGALLNPKLSSLAAAKLRAVVLAVKPQKMDEALTALAAFATASTVIVSIAAGRTIESLAKSLGGDARVVRAMPNLPASIGRGITVAVKGPRVSAAQARLADVLLSAGGEVTWVKDEKLIDPVTAVSGSGPAYLFLLVEALAAAGVAQGLAPDLAARLAFRTATGAGALLDMSTTDPAELRRQVTSPGGTTEAALKVLMDDSRLAKLMAEAVAAATRRARELGK